MLKHHSSLYPYLLVIFNLVSRLLLLSYNQQPCISSRGTPVELYPSTWSIRNFRVLKCCDLNYHSRYTHRSIFILRFDLDFELPFELYTLTFPYLYSMIVIETWSLHFARLCCLKFSRVHVQRSTNLTVNASLIIILVPIPVAITVCTFWWVPRACTCIRLCLGVRVRSSQRANCR